MRIYLRLLFISLLSAQLGACSIFGGDDEVEPAKLVKFESQVELDSLWSRRIGSQGDDELYLRLTPAIDGDFIYAANAKGRLAAIERFENDYLWKAKVGEPLVSAVGAGEELVLAGTVDGQLVALNRDNGTERWRTQLSSEMLSSPQVSGTMVVVQTSDGKLQGIRILDGKLLWTYATSLPALTMRSSAAPLVEAGIAYAAFANGKVVAVDSRNGLLLWQQQVSFPTGRNELERLINFEGQPLSLGNDLYVASYQGSAAGLSKEQGQIQWLEKVSASGQLASGNGNLYITQGDDSVIALKLATGRLLWKNNQLSHRAVTAPAVVGDYVVVADGEGYLHVMDQQTGEFAGRKKLWRDAVRNPLLSDGEVLYLLTNKGKLRAFVVEED